MKLSNYFGDRAFWRKALPLLIPIALQNVLTSSFGIVDTLMISALGDDPLSGTYIASQWSFLLNVMMFGFASGAAVFIAQYWGARQMKGIRQVYGLVMVCAAGWCALMGGVSAIFPEWVVSFFTNASDPSFQYGADYLRIASFSYAAVAISTVANTVLRSTEQPKLPLYVSLATVALNAFLNWLFMFPCGMGVKGAALATVISSWAGPILLYVIGYIRKNVLIAPLSELLDWSGGFVRKYVRVTLPAVLNETIWSLGTVVLNSVYTNLDAGNSFVAALSICRSVENLFFSFVIGLCHASSVMIGISIGAGNIERGKLDGKRFMCIVPAFALLLGLLVVAIRRPMIGVFSELSAEAALNAAQIMLVYWLETSLRNVPYVAVCGVFRAGGDTRAGLVLDFGCLWLISIPVTLLLGYTFHLPLITVYTLMLLSEDVPKSILCFVYFATGRWVRPVVGARSTAE